MLAAFRNRASRFAASRASRSPMRVAASPRVSSSREGQVEPCRRLGAPSLPSRTPLLPSPLSRPPSRPRASASAASGRTGQEAPVAAATLERLFSSTPSAAASVEETYQRKTALEHILLRPGMYIGSSSAATDSLWLLSPGSQDVLKELAAKKTKRKVVPGDGLHLEQQSVTYVPGIVKLFDELLVNAIDNSVRDPSQTRIEVRISTPRKGPTSISVRNNGRGIPVKWHKKEGCYVPELVLGHLMTGSNFDDTKASITGGRHGYGAKLTNIFSTSFEVETLDTKAGLLYRQHWSDNMKSCSEPELSDAPAKAEDYTEITFTPDVSRFGLKSLDEGTLAVIRRRVVDAAASTNGVTVALDGVDLPVHSFEDYMRLFPDGADTPVVYHKSNKRWEWGVMPLQDGPFQCVSFVNGIHTLRGGTHVNAVMDAILKRLVPYISKNVQGTVTPALVKSHMRLFVNCQVPNASFDSQAKEKLVTHTSELGASISVPDRVVRAIADDLGLVTLIQQTLQSRERLDVIRTVRKGTKSSQLRSIPKLEDANNAGGKNAAGCTLILTEGDSAKALAVAGLSVVGRDNYGVFPLRGKVLNVRDMSAKQALKNVEVANLVSILGLDFTKKYETREDVEASLRYGRVMIMTDQDHDGSHIKGLIVNLFHRFWPELLQHDGFLEQFITPLLKARKGKEVREFFNLADFRRFQQTGEWEKGGWKLKYYKGLGTSTAAEGRAYFSDLPRHQRPFMWSSDEDSDAISMAFAKSKVGERKAWLLAPPSTDSGEGEDYSTEPLSYSDFVNRELIEFSRADLIRSIPSVVDGLKPSQRKVLFAAMKRTPATAEVKVAQLAGYCAEHTAYHHGEASLVSTIVKLAQDYVGANNVPLLEPIGQFGTRLQGGKDAASARYIFTKLNPLARLLYPAEDDALLRYSMDDGQTVEPEVYIPIVPVVLLNGTEGIGTGWSTFVPCYNPLEVVDTVIGRLGEQPPPSEPPSSLAPWYRGFRGTFAKTSSGFYSYGCSEQDGRTLRISELPVGRWTDDYKAFLVDAMQKGLVRNFKEYHTVTRPEFVVKLTPAGEAALDTTSVETLFKLRTSFSTKNMHLFDVDQRIKRYECPEEIIDDHFPVRLEQYRTRKEAQLHSMAVKLEQLRNKAAFVGGVLDGSLQLNKFSREKLESELDRRGLLRWRRGGLPADGPLSRLPPAVAPSRDHEATTDAGESSRSGSYDYLLSMPMSQLTQDAIVKAEAEMKRVTDSLKQLEGTSVEQLWTQELLAFRGAVEKLLRDGDSS